MLVLLNQICQKMSKGDKTKSRSQRQIEPEIAGELIAVLK